MKKNIILILLTVLTNFAVASAGKILQFEIVQQIYNQQVWAAVTQQMAKYYTPDSKFEQCDIAEYARQQGLINDLTSNCCETPSLCDQGISFTNFQACLEQFAPITTELIVGGLTIEEIITSIDRGDPIIADIKWKNTSTIATLTIVGYNADTVYYGDTWDASYGKMSFDEFKSNSDFSWYNTIKISRRQNSVIESENGIRIYPNPGQASQFICSNAYFSEIRICDVSGNLVMKFETESTKSYNFDTSILPSGFYICQIYDRGRYVSAVRYIKL